MSLAARYDQFGPASVLKLVDVGEPHPGNGEVRVRVKAAGLNPVDYKKRRGGSKYVVSLPARIGREAAGVVDEVGNGVTALSVGDEVFGLVGDGGIAEAVVVPAENLAHKPSALDWTIAGALALAGQTAHDAFASQHVVPDDVVLVSAAAGGVGLTIAQLAVRAKATVIGTASETHHDFLRQLGVIPVSYGPGLADRVRAAVPRPVTVVFDNHGAETIEAAIELGVPKSRINSIATDPAEYGVVRVGRGATNIATLDKLADLVVSGQLVVPVERTYPLSEVVAAYEHLERGHLRGKIAIVAQ